MVPIGTLEGTLNPPTPLKRVALCGSLLSPPSAPVSPSALRLSAPVWARQAVVWGAIFGKGFGFFRVYKVRAWGREGV